jgi:hypothetical protein
LKSDPHPLTPTTSIQVFLSRFLIWIQSWPCLFQQQMNLKNGVHNTEPNQSNLLLYVHICYLLSIKSLSAPLSYSLFVCFCLYPKFIDLCHVEANHRDCVVLRHEMFSPAQTLLLFQTVYKLQGTLLLIADGNETFLFRVTSKSWNALRKMCMSCCRDVLCGLSWDMISPLYANTALITAFCSQSAAVMVKVQQFWIVWFMYLSYRRCWKCSLFLLNRFWVLCCVWIGLI